MRGVILKGPFEVSVEDLPIPKAINPRDVVVKVHFAGLCGSDLHQYRGREGDDVGFVMGHEAVGEVVDIGSSVQNFKLGDMVVSTFHTSCGGCDYCVKGYTSRCTSAQCLGGPGINGAQAEYICIPLGDSTLLPLPTTIPPQLALLLADILPTGYSAAFNAKRLLDESIESKSGTCVVIGCGPVGLCAITSAKTMFSEVYATDLQVSRLSLAEKHGAIALPLDELRTRLGSKGADAILEVVGHPSALETAMSLVKPYGAISSVGVHSAPISLSGEALYDKNVRLQFGRCSVRTFFPAALKVLEDNIELFKGFIQHTVSVDEAPEESGLGESS